MPRIAAVLFDLDGTLVDSAEDLCAALNRFLGELSLPAVDLPAVKMMIGDGAAKLVERALTATGGDPARTSALLPRFLEIYEDAATVRTRPYPGVEETLTALRDRGIALAVVTNKPVGPSLGILETLSLRHFFRAVIGGDSLAQRKPHPAPVLAALDRLHVTPDAAIMVGDNHHDVAAAKAAGVRAVAVTYGYSHRPHGELGADRLIARMPELMQDLEEATA